MQVHRLWTERLDKLFLKSKPSHIILVFEEAGDTKLAYCQFDFGVGDTYVFQGMEPKLQNIFWRL